MTMKTPKILNTLDSIWLCYGGIRKDCTHAEVIKGREVLWCEDQQEDSDVKYIRADIAKKLKKEIAILKDQMQRLQKIENAADYLLNCIGSEWEQRATNELRNTIAGS